VLCGSQTVLLNILSGVGEEYMGKHLICLSQEGLCMKQQRWCGRKGGKADSQLNDEERSGSKVVCYTWA
jgi:hypothetical protein